VLEFLDEQDLSVLILDYDSRKIFDTRFHKCKS
jgi:hypothetical protein